MRLIKIMRVGVRGKLISILTMIAVVQWIGSCFVLWTVDGLGEVKGRVEHVVEAQVALNAFDQQFAEANLLGMDIIVDHYEQPKQKVLRREEYAEFAARAKASRGKAVAAIERLYGGELASGIEKDVVTMVDGIQALIDTIDQGQASSEKLAEFDEVIDGAKEHGQRNLDAIQLAASKDFQAAESEMAGMFDNVKRAIWISVLVGIGVTMLMAAPTIFSMTKTIKALQANLAKVARSLKFRSDELTGSSRTLAEISSQAAAAVQESVSSMAEMSAMISQTSRNAATTAELSRDVLDQARDGVAVMGEMSSSMQDISASSQRLGEIERIIENIVTKTNVINEVVFKTQLLAVNASIEAARAGQYGKGFAVVANEVASLAALSGRASGEIKDLLRSSSEHVKDIISETAKAVRRGESSTGKSQDAFQRISSSVGLIVDKVEQISVASREQEAGVSQTSVALTQMNQATNSVNSLAQESSQLGREIEACSSSLWSVDRGMARIVTGRLESSASRQVSDGFDDEASLGSSPVGRDPSREAISEDGGDAVKSEGRAA